MEQKIRAIIRIVDTDLDGNKGIYNSLKKIKGVGFMFSNAICNFLNIDRNKKTGALNEKEIKDIEDFIISPNKLPNWILNRRKDYDGGKDLHLTGSKLNLTKEFDIKRLKKIKSYRGMRHAFGLPVRGQKTRGHFRKGKSVGVQKKKLQQQKKSGSSKEGDKKK